MLRELRQSQVDWAFVTQNLVKLWHAMNFDYYGQRLLISDLQNLVFHRARQCFTALCFSYS